MQASRNGHLDIVRTLLEIGGDINAKSNVRNQMMMMMIMMIIKVLSIIMLMVMMSMILIMVVVNDEDIDD